MIFTGLGGRFFELSRLIFHLTISGLVHRQNAAAYYLILQDCTKSNQTLSIQGVNGGVCTLTNLIWQVTLSVPHSP